MSEVPILKETTRTTGREALRNNITAAMALAGAVRTTLGPLGQDKLLIDDEGRTMVTNDGVTVLESAKVEHPVAKMLINASTTQDRIARDGTCRFTMRNARTLVVLFVGDTEKWWRKWRPMSRAHVTGLFGWPTKSRDFATKWWRLAVKSNVLRLQRPAHAAALRVQAFSARLATCGIYSTLRSIKSRC